MTVNTVETWGSRLKSAPSHAVTASQSIISFTVAGRVLQASFIFAAPIITVTINFG